MGTCCSQLLLIYTQYAGVVTFNSAWDGTHRLGGGYIQSIAVLHSSLYRALRRQYWILLWPIVHTTRNRIAKNFQGVNILQFCQMLLKNKIFMVKIPATHCGCYEQISLEKIFTAMLRPLKIFS